VDTFEQELEQLINKYSKENGSNTPDFILAEYLVRCLRAFNVGVKKREDWYKSWNFPTDTEKKRNHKETKNGN